MKIKGSKVAFIYGMIPALGGFTIIFASAGINTNTILGCLCIILSVCIIFGYILIKEIEVNSHEIIIRKYLSVKETKILTNNISNIEISKGVVTILKINDKPIKFQEYHLNKNDLEKFKKYIDKHIN